MGEVVRNVVTKEKFEQEASSEMFVNSVDVKGYQKVQTPRHPVRPYGCAKVRG